MLNDIITVQDKVKYVLEKDPLARDCDKRCWMQCMVKFYQFKVVLHESVRKEGIDGFINWFLDKKTPSMESVRRCRQKLQEKFPELRGTTYKKRHKEAKGVREWAKH